LNGHEIHARGFPKGAVAIEIGATECSLFWSDTVINQIAWGCQASEPKIFGSARESGEVPEIFRNYLIL
jgi:hypothetical protein